MEFPCRPLVCRPLYDNGNECIFTAVYFNDSSIFNLELYDTHKSVIISISLTSSALKFIKHALVCMCVCVSVCVCVQPKS